MLVILNEYGTKLQKNKEGYEIETIAFKQTVIETTALIAKSILSFQTLRKSIPDTISCFNWFGKKVIIGNSGSRLEQFVEIDLLSLNFENLKLKQAEVRDVTNVANLLQARETLITI